MAPVVPEITTLLDSVVNQLYRDSVTVTRTMTINQQRSQQTLKWIDWKKELALFYRSDISNASTAARYEADTLDADSVRVLTFLATDSSLRTRKLQLFFKNDRLEKMYIRNAQSSWWSEMQEELYLFPEEGYSIRSNTSNRLFGHQQMLITGLFHVGKTQP
ncbi:MAG: hypothetical protein NZL95_09635 [Chitinophagales bacterium]|nr:hypothetical protein [Chitinophagales bacterium]MDW8428794.1 hypothetical protein [Chitinophagales bacterium]